MKILIRFLCFCIGISLVFSSVLIAEEKHKAAALAVVVYNDIGSEELGKSLQPLLEAEAGLQWDGKIVERADIDKLLNEMKISRSGLADPNTQLQFGKMIHMDCLLTVRINKESVKTTLSLFPSTTIIHEKEYRERLEPHSLAMNIVISAIKAYHEHSRDPNKPQVSIGLFFNTAPFKQHLDFSKNIRIQLRQELVKDKLIVLTERLQPSDLLSEFELARAAITESIARNLSAPPSDILLYGEFKPKPEQDLTKPAAELDFTLFIVSPTGLCENQKIEFSCYSNEPDVVIKQGLKLIEQVSNEVRTKLASGKIRTFSQKEFEEIKRLSLMTPLQPHLFMNSTLPLPLETNNDNKILEKYEPVFHMLECAMLFKGDDAQILIRMGQVLRFMADHKRDNRTFVIDENMLKAAIAYTERAYLLENNPETRDAYYTIWIGMPVSENLKEESLKAANHIWDTRNTGNWKEGHTVNSLRKIIESEVDTKEIFRLFLEYIKEDEQNKVDIGVLSYFFDELSSRINGSEKDNETNQFFLDCSESLVQEKAVLARWIGHLFYIMLHTRYNNKQQNYEIPVYFIEHFRESLNLMTKLEEKYKDSFAIFSLVILSAFDAYEKTSKKNNMKDDSIELKEKLIIEYTQGALHDSIIIEPLLNKLVKQFWDQKEYEHGYNLLTKYLNYHNDEPLFRKRIKFRNAMLNISQSGIERFEKIEFEGINNISISNLIASDNGIYGIGSSIVFHLTSNSYRPVIFKEIAGGPCDLACSDRFLGVATSSNGFFLLDRQSLKLQHFTPINSGFPGQSMSIVQSTGKNFLVGIQDGKNNATRMYLFETDINKISLIKERMNSINVEKQNLKNTLYITRDKGTTIVLVSDTKETKQLNCEKNDLSNLKDIIIWQDKLIFTTNTDLYIRETGSNNIFCIISNPEITFNLLCTLDNHLYIGTSEGLYCITAEKFREMVKQVEETVKR